MIAAATTPPALVGRELHKTFRRDTKDLVTALDGVSLAVEHGVLAALVGPDGAGKTTLMRLAAGLLSADSGELSVLGTDVALAPQQVQSRIGYMPQRFGLYEDLTVRENLDLYADLHALPREQRPARYAQLMDMTALGPFVARLAGRLSGGMKQKLGLACTLVSSPDLLLLDEPTVGVDPLSRRELWTIIDQLVQEQHRTVLLSTAYLDEAERCGHVVVLHEGKVLAQGVPSEVRGLAAGRTFAATPPPGQTARGLQARLLDDVHVIDAVPEGGRVRIVLAADQNGGAPAQLAAQPLPARFEDGFMILLRRGAAHAPAGAEVFGEPPRPVQDGVAVAVHDLVRKFGSFVAVDHVSFQVRRGEIFGLLGPNGAGKTTTFRMLCGLLPATAGTLRVAGTDVRHARASARQRIGYVAQKFSLYEQLTVLENLDFFAKAYGLRGGRKDGRIEWALRQFELEPLARVASGQISAGFKRRLAMAAALLHEPETLFLDEPTSGADPLARREFWRRITALAEQGVTVIVTTHFMEEAEYCDRVAILDAGRVLAQGTPAEVRRLGQPEPGREPTMEDAFVAIVQESRQRQSSSKEGTSA
jgi:ABC-2 type transport system ATP-binding protein